MNSSTAQIISLPELHDDGPAHPDAGPPIAVDWSPLHQVQATLQVHVGELNISVGELLAARERQVLQLERPVDGPVDLCIEGRAIARGQLIAVDGRFAVRITELPVALDLATRRADAR